MSWIQSDGLTQALAHGGYEGSISRKSGEFSKGKVNGVLQERTILSDVSGEYVAISDCAAQT
jgi:hypothetical protein